MNAKVYFSCVDSYWTDIQIHVKDAVVYMDDHVAECLHWHGGITKLMNFGAASVENFTPFVKTDSSVKKVVFIISSALNDETLKTLMIIIRANSFKECYVFTPLPPKFHVAESSEESSFTHIENMIYGWMGSINYSVSVEYAPILTAHIAHNLFVLPSVAKDFSVFTCGLFEMNRKRNADTSLKNFPVDMQTSIMKLSYCLDEILNMFQVKADVFSLGLLSQMVGFELSNLSHVRKKQHSRKVSVVIVDRLLDLAGPLSQSYETMLDQALKTFPHLSGHMFDVAIPMSDLAACEDETVFDRPLIAPGCFAHKSSPEELTAFYAILEKNPRAAIIEVNRQVVEAAANDGLNLDLTLRLSPETLMKRVLAFKQKPELLSKYNGLLQIALAVVKTAEHLSKNSVDQLSATEKALIQYLTSSPEEVLSNIMQMISERHEVNYKMDEILIFLAFIYMLSSCPRIENESALQGTLMETFFQEDLTELLNLFVDEDLEDDSILSVVKTFFNVLKRLGTVRKPLKKYNSIFKSTNPAFPASYDPLLKQFLQDMFNPSLPDIPDLEFHAGGLTDYIKTGFSLFMNMAKPQPRDNQDVLLVVLGGLTPSEIKFIRDFEAQQKGRQIFVCCTQVLTPHDVLKDLASIVKSLLHESSNKEDN